MAVQVIHNISLPAFCDREILRYMGMRNENAEINALLNECLTECKDIFAPAVCFRCFDIHIEKSIVDFGNFRFESKDLAKCLRGCRRAVIFVATAGFEIDRLIKKYATLSPARALSLSAIGSERIECVCDAFCDMLKKTYGALRPRFSAGYGDLSLEAQGEIFRHLDATRHTGVTLSDTYLMAPTKSVSAIVGIDEAAP